MNLKSEKLAISLAGMGIGVIAALLVLFGNPTNMGFCIACFLRDTAGGLKLHSAKVVQYVRPEIIGLVLGSFALAMVKKEWNPKGGSAPLTRFVLGFFVMIGCLCFLGCPFRMILRLAGGDLNAVFGLIGFVAGILCGVFFLNRGYSLKRTYKQPAFEGAVMVLIQLALLVLLVGASSLLAFSESGPGAKHAPVLLALAAGLIVGALAQRTRLCMVGGIRDAVLFGESKLLAGFAAIFAAALVSNLLLNVLGGAAFFKPGTQGQAVSHSAQLWNVLGMMLVGFGCTLLGGCPLRQLILAGEGNTDSAITVLGLTVGAAFCHNFGLAGAADAVKETGEYVIGGPGVNGKIAVIIGLAVVTIIACMNTFARKREK